MDALRVVEFADRPAMDLVAAVSAWLDGPDRPIVIETSGTTGQPKKVELARSAVLASVTATAQRLGGSGQWVLALPHTYVAGVQVIVRSLVAGHEPTLDLGDLAEGGRYVSLVPTQLSRLLRHPGPTDALTHAEAVLLGGGPIDPDLRLRAAEVGIKTVATYGSAETSGGCVYDGSPLPGVEVRAEDDGRLAIAGPMVFTRYLEDPDLTAASLVDGWFRTGDHGEVASDGSVRVLGRIDDVIVSGGINIPGGVVAARLREHPAVSAAEVVGVPDPDWGRSAVAVVAGSISLEDVRSWVVEAHPRAWAPKRVVVVDAIPTDDRGKPDRRALERVAVGDGPATS